MARSHLILGGRRSGKSAYAEALACEMGLPKTYIATSRIYDEGHAARIRAHRERREGQGWQVIEAGDPQALQGILEAQAAQPGAILVECLSMWLNNVLLDEAEVPRLQLPPGPGGLLFVSMEVGLGLHGETPLGRAYSDALGLLNQHMAAQVDQVDFIAAGLPLRLKG